MKVAPATLRLAILGALLLGACGEGGPGSVPPLDSARITSVFGLRAKHPLKRSRGPVHHRGFDLAAPAGSPIRAARAGQVLFAGKRGGYGNTVEIDHGGGLVTRYAHASRLAARPGQRVQGGEVVAYVGSTGLSTGPHLHYELRLFGKAIDPRDSGFALVAEARRATRGSLHGEVARLQDRGAGGRRAHRPLHARLVRALEADELTSRKRRIGRAAPVAL